jgi:ferrochelatase
MFARVGHELEQRERTPAAPSARGAAEPLGVLLVNLGTPDAPTPRAVRRYLDEFLGDPLVVDLQPVLWWLIRKALVLPLRARRSAELYSSIWSRAGSPLLAHARDLAGALATELGPAYRVAVAMRYGNPSLAAGLEELERQGCRRAVIAPLFPQWSRSTSGSIAAAVARALARSPLLEHALLEPYYGDPGYVAAVAARVREAGLDGVDHLVLSFHGLPERYVAAGDPYREQCEATAQAVAAELDLDPGRFSLAFQSRFGRGRWLEPDVAELVPALARGSCRVLVACPGFAADCLETLEELHVRLRRRFLASGGIELRVAPCLNSDPRWAGALARLVREAAQPLGERAQAGAAQSAGAARRG